jgi:hypothetical protein
MIGAVGSAAGRQPRKEETMERQQQQRITQLRSELRSLSRQSDLVLWYVRYRRIELDQLGAPEVLAVAGALPSSALRTGGKPA